MCLHFESIFTHGNPSPLEWDQLRGRIPRLLPRHILHKLDRAGRIVFFLICLTDQVLQTFTASLYGADGNFLVPHEYASIRIFEKYPPPTARLHAPGTGEHAPFHDDRPDADHAVRGLPAGANAEYLLFTNGIEDLLGETIPGCHRLISVVNSIGKLYTYRHRNDRLRSGAGQFSALWIDSKCNDSMRVLVCRQQKGTRGIDREITRLPASGSCVMSVC